MFRKSVDTVLAAFHKAIAELKDVEANHLEAAEVHIESSQRFQQLATDARNEADRARRVLERMTEVFK